jgi:hypothetical protein
LLFLSLFFFFCNKRMAKQLWGSLCCSSFFFFFPHFSPFFFFISDYLFKVVVIGESGVRHIFPFSVSLFFFQSFLISDFLQQVGKSCLLLRYSDNAFSETFISTIGLSFLSRLWKTEKKKKWQPKNLICSTSRCGL